LTILTLIAAVTGVVLLWMVKRFSDQARIAVAKHQMRARLYAMRLYTDDPALILRAQRELLLWTARYLAHMLRPIAIAAVPAMVLFLQLDNVYGHRPLGPGESAVVTAQFGGGTDVRALAATLEGRGVVVETPGVRVPDRRQICWRVRAIDRISGSLVLHAGGQSISKACRCGHGLWGLSPSIQVSCQAPTMDVFGYGMDWAWWFGIVSLISMLAMRRRFGVAL